MTSTLPTRIGSFQDLQGHQQLALREWFGYAIHGEGKVGLWVYGNHGEGSSYVGIVGLRRMLREFGDEWEYVTALDLMDQVRISWSADAVSRGNSNDYDLYTEAASFETALEKLWTVKVLLIDDLYDSHDMSFFTKHLWTRLLQRVKQGLPTIVCTNMPPSSYAVAEWRGTIESWFVTCYAER